VTISLAEPPKMQFQRLELLVKCQLPFKYLESIDLWLILLYTPSGVI
jgi:hypothetical protein